MEGTPTNIPLSRNGSLLEKKMKYPLYSHDAFVSIMGGIKVGEPGVDLGLLLAVVSSYQGIPVCSKTVAMGEVGLNGEIRSVVRVESRIKEAIHMGFSRCILPKRNLIGLSAELNKKIELVGVGSVEECGRNWTYLPREVD